MGSLVIPLKSIIQNKVAILLNLALSKSDRILYACFQSNANFYQSSLDPNQSIFISVGISALIQIVHNDSFIGLHSNIIRSTSITNLWFCAKLFKNLNPFHRLQAKYVFQ